MDPLAALELEKLRTEVALLRQERSKPWLVRMTLPVLIASLAASFSTWVFSDSLAEQTRAEIRREVLVSYLDIDNSTVGKRKQILDFVQDVLSDDPRLEAWMKHEREAIAQSEQKIADEMEEIDKRLEELDAEIAAIDARAQAPSERAEASSERAQTPSFSAMLGLKADAAETPHDAAEGAPVADAPEVPAKRSLMAEQRDLLEKRRKKADLMVTDPLDF